MICGIVTALVLVGLVVWFVAGSAFGGGGWGFQGRSFFNIGNIGSFENLTGPFEETGRYSINPSGVNTIDIDWIAGEVTVIPHGGTEIIVTEYAQRELRDNERFEVRADGSTLRISYVERGVFLRNINVVKRLQVLVPTALSESMRELSINSVSGAIVVEGITADTLDTNSTSGATDIRGAFKRADLNSVSGAVRMENSAINSRADVNNISGATNISGTFDRVDISAISGSVTMRSEAVPGSADISTVSGSVTILLPDTGESLSINHSSVSGRLSSDIPHTTTSGRAQLDISTVSGGTTVVAIGG